MSPQELRALVEEMRALGVLQADGVVLGPPPTKLEQLETKQAKGEAIDQEELAAERRRQRVESLRQEVRDKVGREDMSDDECDRYIRPELLQ